MSAPSPLPCPFWDVRRANAQPRLPAFFLYQLRIDRRDGYGSRRWNPTKIILFG